MIAPAAAVAAAPWLVSWLPCLASCACCAAQGACSVCCSLAACFGCRYNAFLAKLTYVAIFLGSACLAIFFRYWGEATLGSVVAIGGAAYPGFCAASQCWGLQAAYRVSLALAVFFGFLCLLAAAAPITHLGGWLVKLLLYAVLLGLAFLPPNDSLLQYAAVARGFSVLFMLAQVLIIIDFAYNAHEWLVERVDRANAAFAARNFEPGLLSNGWGVLYVGSSLVLILGAVGGLCAMYVVFGRGACQLQNFFISETLVLGVGFVFLCMNDAVRKGLLPPSILFAYNAYLCYGALTNDPDAACNPTAAGQNDASIFSGLAIAALSVTWMAYSSAGSIEGAVRLEAGGGGGERSGARVRATTNVAHAATTARDWPTPTGAAAAAAGAGIAVGAPASAGAGAGASAAAPLQQPAGAEKAAPYQLSDAADEEKALARSAAPVAADAASGGAGGGDVDYESEAAAVRASSPWVFDAVMCLAGMYLAMLVTNWGDPGSSNLPTSNPELSSASMWVRMGTQFAIWVVFLWSIIAPLIFPNRDFSSSKRRRVAESI
jgi:hypothetical protein